MPFALLREFDTDGLLDTSDYSRFEDSVNEIQKAYLLKLWVTKVG